MKTVKHLSVLLAVLLVASLLVVGFVVNAEETTAITVTNEEEFAAAMVEANASATIVLANDITLTNGNTTMPGAFAGTFDGQGYTISGITSTVFAKVSGGTVKNVTFNGAITGANRDLATVTVRADSNAVLENVTSNVNLTVTGNQNDLNAGGIVGYGKKVSFTKCTYAGTYTAENGGGGGFGGIVGYVNNDGQADAYTDCAFTGKIVVNGEQTGTLNLGAIVGRAKSGAITITNPTNKGTFELNNAACAYKFGGIAGTLEDAGSIISGAFVQDTITKAEGVNANRVVFIGNAANGIVATGAIKMDDKYLANDGVGLAAVLANMAEDSNVQLNADVTLPEGTPTVDLTYKGTFDGQGYTISGLSNTMFKALDGATIKNVNFKGTIVSDNRKASTIAYDTANDVWFTDITSYVDITCNAGNPNAGGIIGYGKTVTCTNVTYAGNYVVNSNADTEVGGIAGYTRHNGGTKTSTYTNCAFTGTITVNNATAGHIYVGAILGNGREGTNNLVNCVSTGKITVNAGEALTDVVASGTAGNNNASTYNITNCVNLTTFEGIEGVDGVAKGNAATTNGLFNATHADGDAFVFNGVEYQKYTAEGTSVYLEVAANKIVTDIPGYGAAFSAGTVTVDKNVFVIGTDDLSAFISVRDGATEGTNDYRFVIAADLEKFVTYGNANLLLTFTKDGEVVATATKNVVTDLKVYASAVAAGNTYVAAEGDILTGIVITDVPADAWDAVSVTVVDGETILATGTVENADVPAQALYTITANTIDLNEVDGAIYSIAIEEHHEQHNYNPAFVVCIDNADIYKDIYSGGYNPNYTWYLSVNGGVDFIPASFSEHDGGEWGYLRAELGAEYATVSELNIALAIVDNTTREAAYYSEFYIHYGFYYDETKPSGVTAIAPGDITVIAGPDLDGDEGAKKAFDGKHNTKVCTGDVGADNALIVELKNTFSLVGVGICNANDNEGNSSRTVLDFEIYVSADGTTWGEAVYVATAGDKNKADYSTNFQEMYHAFAAAVDAKFVKVVVNNGGLYQIADVLLYVGEAAFEGKLPTSGITQLKVVECASDSNLTNWADGKDEYLFDGGYGITQVGGTKIGGGVANGGFTMTFSLEAPATVTYYTFITGRDSNGARNPKSWTLYGKNAAGEWVVVDTVDEETATATMGKTNSRAYNYKTANPGEYKDYKIEFATEGMFQMDEMILFANDATAGTDKLALVGGMEYVPFHTRGDFAGETNEFRLTCKAEGGHFSQETIHKVTAEGAYVYLKDTTNGGEFVRYEIANLRIDRWCDFYITLDGFTPVAGVEYEVVFVFVGSEGSKCPGELHYMTTTGLKLAQ